MRAHSIRMAGRRPAAPASTLCGTLCLGVSLREIASVRSASSGSNRMFRGSTSLIHEEALASHSRSGQAEHLHVEGQAVAVDEVRNADLGEGGVQDVGAV